MVGIGCSRIALVLAIVSSAGACATNDTAAPPESAPASSVAASTPVNWGPCAADGYGGEPYPDRAECGTVEVPVDYGKPDGAKAQLAVLRFKATGDKIGSLVLNPGGPGASGVQFAADAMDFLTPPLLERFDVVGFDPRGVGDSTPAIKCVSDEDFDASRADDGVIVTAADVDRENGETRAFVQSCVDSAGVDFLASVGTDNVVKDMDRLRSALGDEKLTYLGYSYGTHLGSQYAEAFPQNVRAMVLDGAVDPSAEATQSLIDQYAAFQTVFDDYAADCTAKAGCPLGSDPAKAVAVFHQLVDPLVEAPAVTDDPRGLSYQDAMMGTFNALYDDESWEDLTKGLSALAGGGRPDELLEQADIYYERDEDGHYTNWDNAYIAISCVDYRYPKDAAAYPELDRRLREVAPFNEYGSFTGLPGFMGGYGHLPLNTCAFWPVPPTSKPHRVSAPGLPTVLVISTTEDPATPYQDGVDLAEQLGARLLTFEGAQHTASYYGNACVDDPTTKYLIDLTLPPDGTRC